MVCVVDCVAVGLTVLRLCVASMRPPIRPTHHIRKRIPIAHSTGYIVYDRADVCRIRTGEIFWDQDCNDDD